MLQLTSIISQIGPSVARLGRGSRRGSGVVVAPDRVVVLSRSLAAEHDLEVVLGGAHETGQVVGTDRSAGVSLVQVTTGDARPLEWAQAIPAPGEVVYALGDPGPVSGSPRAAVSAAPVHLRGLGGRPLSGIEHTAPLPRGCGGGPLVNADGALVGLNALRTDPGFLVASGAVTVRPAIERMLAGASEPEPLGVAIAPARVARRLRQAVGLPKRMVLVGVLPGSVAERAGLSVGDLIVRLGEAAVATPDELLGGLERIAGRVPVGVVRGVDELELEAVFNQSGDRS